MKQFNINPEALKKEAFLALLEEGHTLSMPAKGWSMHPFIKDGDRVFIKYIEPGYLKIGGIIAYKRRDEENTIVHRLVKKKIKRGKVIMFAKGDSNHCFSCNEVVPEEDFLGRVIEIEQNGKKKKLDTFFWGIIGYMYAKISYHAPWFLKVLRAAVKRIKKIRKGSAL